MQNSQNKLKYSKNIRKSPILDIAPYTIQSLCVFLSSLSFVHQDQIQNRFNKFGVSLRTKFSPLVHRKFHNPMSRSHSSPTNDFLLGSSNNNPHKGTYDTTGAPSSLHVSPSLHQHSVVTSPQHSLLSTNSYEVI